MSRGRAMAAREAHNLKVAGSNPAPATRQDSSVVEQCLHKAWVAGSIPAPATKKLLAKSE